MSEHRINILTFWDAVGAVEAASGKAAKLKRWAEYYDGLHKPQQRAAKHMICAMIDPACKFGGKFQDYQNHKLSTRPETDDVSCEHIEKLSEVGYDDQASGYQARLSFKAILTEGASEEAGVILAQVFSKGKKIGLGARTLAALFPGTVETFEVMLAHKFRESDLKFPVAVEPKLDGIRCIVRATANEKTSSVDIDFFTRSGKEIKSLSLHEPLLKELTGLAMYAGTLDDTSPCSEVIFDAEVMSEGGFNKTSSEIRQKERAAENVSLCIFDLLPEGFLMSLEPDWPEAGTYSERRKRLTKSFRALQAEGEPIKFIKISESYLANSLAEVLQIYNSCRERDLEGVIVKDLEGIYERKRSRGWMKIKPKETADLTVVGAFEGAGKYRGKLGGIIVDFKGKEVSVGTGISDAERDSMWADFIEDSTEGRAFDDMKLIGKLAEVSYHEMTPDGSLRHPVFHRLRTDKHEVSF